ncbi:hypothetical protein AcV7_010456 [Taiwanofungus camphoratus]|nr:hypothetical protein AcV7_010456 [Antrodia cinnamomea]
MFPRNTLSTLSVLALSLVHSSLGQEQFPASVPFSHENDAVNFTKLFSSELVFRETWAKESWNGLTTFAAATPLRCFGSDGDIPYDVAVLGAPFDTATSFRPGARFGPNGIRQGARRLGVSRINVPMKIRVSDYLDVVDCGDVPMVYVDNKVALRQLELANKALLSKLSLRSFDGTSLAKDGKFHPRVLTLGGDHTITLPLLRGVAGVYGPVSVIHFDSHIDTWKPRQMVGDIRLYTARSSLLRGPDYLLGIDRRAAHGFPERKSRSLMGAISGTRTTRVFSLRTMPTSTSAFEERSAAGKTTTTTTKSAS